MPEEIITRYICDAPGDSREGRKYMLSDGKTTVDVILCPAHEQSASVVEAMSWGVPPKRSATPGPSRGLGRERLISLIQPA